MGLIVALLSFLMGLLLCLALERVFFSLSGCSLEAMATIEEGGVGFFDNSRLEDFFVLGATNVTSKSSSLLSVSFIATLHHIHNVDLPCALPLVLFHLPTYTNAYTHTPTHTITHAHTIDLAVALALANCLDQGQ